VKILAIKKQAELSGLMDSIGKQITGWRNANRQMPELYVLRHIQVSKV